MLHNSRLALFLFVFAVVALAISKSAYAGGDVDSGKKIAEKFCAVCHATAADARRPHEDRPASFQEIADMPGMDELALKVFFQTPHKQMPNLSITGDVRDDLIAYITSLKRN